MKNFVGIHPSRDDFCATGDFFFNSPQEIDTKKFANCYAIEVLKKKEAKDCNTEFIDAAAAGVAVDVTKAKVRHAKREMTDY